MQQRTQGYSWEDIEALGAAQRIHVLEGVIFRFTDELELAALPDIHDPRYTPDYGNTQPSAIDDEADRWEAVQQSLRPRRSAYATEARHLLAEAQTWLDDPNNRYKPGAPNFLRYGTNQQGQWRNDYGVLVREGDQSYAWAAPNGAFYVLIERGGRIVAIVREYPERLRVNQ